MSIAVAVAKQHRLVLAADSQENFGDRKVDRANHRASKIMTAGGSYIAATGWGLYDNILEDYLARAPAPRLGTRQAVFAFFMRLWKQLGERYTLVNDQPHQDDPSPFADVDASFLVVNGAGIFHVASNLSVTQFHQYYAVGSGASYALGALHASYGGPLDAEAIARGACEAAMAFDVFCGGDLDVYPVAARAKRRRARR